jgi:hypothetical protein
MNDRSRLYGNLTPGKNEVVSSKYLFAPFFGTVSRTRAGDSAYVLSPITNMIDGVFCKISKKTETERAVCPLPFTAMLSKNPAIWLAGVPFTAIKITSSGYSVQETGSTWRKKPQIRRSWV